MCIKAQTLVEFLTARRSDVRLVYCFGSFVDGREKADSDLDIAMLCAKPMDNLCRWELAQKLAVLVGRDVDLVDLANCSTVLRFEVIKHGQCLFDDGIKAQFENVTLSMYQHLQESRADIIDNFVKVQLNG